MKDLDIIVKMKFGSHLYGTDTPESDTDYKSVFMPSAEQILLGKIPKSINVQTKKGDSKNTSDDIDTEIYSFHYFIHLACEGETVALDMLHAPDPMIIETSDLWKEIVANRHLFYTKNLRSFIGYARRQASKYGIKGSRINDAKRVLDFLEDKAHGFNPKIADHWDNLPEGEHIFKYPPDENGVRMYEVCGRKVGETSSLKYAYDVVKKFHDAYGERARQAANNESIDWKAVSHAMRAAYQTEQIFNEGTIKFPLWQAGFLREIKQGKHKFQDISPLLDSLIERVERLSLESSLPEKVNRKFWDKFIINKTLESINKERKQT